jgi:hypothetical protein
MYPESGVRLELTLTGQRTYEGGMVLLEYAVQGATARMNHAAAAEGE